jgi:ribonuclease VapC
MTVLDASAVLAWLKEELGADLVGPEIPSAVISAANFSEVLQKSIHARANPTKVGELLLARGLTVEPVTIQDAEQAAHLWKTAPHLSLADRLCLALTTRFGCKAMTTDAAWRGIPQVKLIR